MGHHLFEPWDGSHQNKGKQGESAKEQTTIPMHTLVFVIVLYQGLNAGSVDVGRNNGRPLTHMRAG